MTGLWEGKRLKYVPKCRVGKHRWVDLPWEFGDSSCACSKCGLRRDIYRHDGDTYACYRPGTLIEHYPDGRFQRQWLRQGLRLSLLPNGDIEAHPK